jgi:hypothetical protein
VSDAPLTPAQIAHEEAQAAKEGYLHRTLVGVDQFANVLLGGNPDETISSRSQRAANRGNLVGKFMTWWLGKIQPSHGYDAESGDVERAEKVEALETQDLSKQDGK